VEGVGFPGAAAARDLPTAVTQLAQELLVLLRDGGHHGQEAVLVDSPLLKQKLSPVLHGEQGEQHMRRGQLLPNALRNVVSLGENLSKIRAIDHFRSRLEYASEIVYTQQIDGAKYRLQPATSGCTPSLPPLRRGNRPTGKGVAMTLACGRTTAAKEHRWRPFYSQPER